MKDFLLILVLCVACFVVGLQVGRNMQPLPTQPEYQQEPEPQRYDDGVDVPPGAWIEPPGRHQGSEE